VVDGRNRTFHRWGTDTGGDICFGVAANGRWEVKMTSRYMIDGMEGLKDSRYDTARTLSLIAECYRTANQRRRFCFVAAQLNSCLLATRDSSDETGRF
jgi:hypothetical protein